MEENRYRFELARSLDEVNEYFNLRRMIFCTEQGLFQDSDVDSIDDIAYPIIAIENATGWGSSSKSARRRAGAASVLAFQKG